jgi:TPR repeat protein
MLKHLIVATLLSSLLCGSVFADDDDDDDARIDQLKSSASHGNVRSQLELSNIYQSGRVIPQNYKKALYWLHQAAKQNNADAEFGIGKMYQLGHGVPQSDQEAAKWFARSGTHRPS